MNIASPGRRKFMVAGIVGGAGAALSARSQEQPTLATAHANSAVRSRLWAKDVVLCYVDPPDSVSELRSSAANWQGENFKWVLAYCDLNGAPRKSLFDGFLFMAYNFKERALLQLKDRQPGTIKDWSDALDLYLASARNLSRCTGEIAQALHQQDRRTKIIFAVPYPDTRNTSFGPVGGRMLNFTVPADRETAVRWFIDEGLARWEKLRGGQEHRNVWLTGFYWFKEGISTATGDPAVVRAFCRHIHSKSLLSYWVPSLTSGKHPAPWRQWGLDYIAQQINYVNPDRHGRSLVTFDDATLVARTMGMDGVQINFSNRTSSLNPRLWNWRQQALANLEAALRLDWKSFPTINYYNANEIVAIARDPQSREYYDALARLVDGTLSYAEVDAMCDRLAQEMHAAGQLSAARLARIKATNDVTVLLPARVKLSLMEKPLDGE